jgi:two-component system sensor histidine kinase BaeS
MKITAQLILVAALTALFSTTLTGVLSLRAIQDRVPRAMGALEEARGPNAAGAQYEARHAMSAASRSLISELQGATTRAAVLALLFGTLAGGAVALSTITPLRRLAVGMRRYAAGERHVRVDLRGRDEVAELGAVFNEMAATLEAELDQRRRLTSDIAHELRTPLTVLKSELEAIQDGLMKLDAGQVEALLGQVNLLARLVSDLRLLSLAEGGELELQLETISLSELLERVVYSFRQRAAARGMELELMPLPAGDHQVRIDPERMQQVLGALFDNALNYASEGGRIEVELRCGAREHTVVVRDFGPGFRASELPLLFQRLYRGDAARSRTNAAWNSGTVTGSGLGLSIVAALVGLHGGRVEASNHLKGVGGAELSVVLPSHPS